MKAVFGIRHFSSPSEPLGALPIPLQVSEKDCVETVVSEALSISFVARSREELADCLLATGDWVIGVVGKIYHRDYPHQPDLLAQLLTEHRDSRFDLLVDCFGEFVLVVIDKQKSDGLEGGELTAEVIEALIAERKQARADKNFARGDEIRDELETKGVILLDSREGTTWKLK